MMKHTAIIRAGKMRPIVLLIILAVMCSGIAIASTVELNFSDSTSNKAYRYNSGNKQDYPNAPTWANPMTSVTEVSSNSYTNLSIPDNINSTIRSTGADRDPSYTFRFIFNRTAYAAPSYVNWIYLQIAASETGNTEIAYCYVANQSSSTWVLFNISGSNGIVSGTTLANLTGNYTSGNTAQDLLNASNGVFQVYCYGDSMDSGEGVFFDFARIIVNFNSSSLAEWNILNSSLPFSNSSRKYIGNMTNYYANFTNTSTASPINGTQGGCSINFTGISGSSPQAMAFNSTKGVFEYNRTINISGPSPYYINCTGPGFDSVNITGSITGYYPGAPSISNYSGNTTNITSVSNYTDLPEFTIDVPGKGMIRWISPVNITGYNIDAYSGISSNFVMVDTSQLSGLNLSANISLYNLPYQKAPAIYEDGAYCSQCGLISYSGSTLIFNVTHFTNYTTGVNSNLTAWDSLDPDTPFYNISRGVVGTMTGFFANYTNSTSGSAISGASEGCSINFTTSPASSPQEMAYNSTTQLYQYNRSFSAKGQYDYNINCTSADYEPINASDSISILDGIITLESIYPTGDIDVNKNKFFDISLNLSCIAGTCSNISVTLDPAGWYNTSWSYRKNLSLNGSQINGTLTDFPVLISITDSDLASKSLPSGYDILFTGSDGTTRLQHEIELYNSTTGQLVAWVKVPSLSPGASQELFMYYGNNESAPQANKTGVWTNNYILVYHFNDNESTDQVNDSAQYGINATRYSSTNFTPGQIGKAIGLYGDGNSWITTNNTAYLDTTQFWTIEAWAYKTNAIGNYQTIMLRDTGGSNSNYGMQIDLGEEWTWVMYSAGVDWVEYIGPVSQVAEWTYMVNAFDNPNNAALQYVNGNLTINQTETGNPSTGQPLTIGKSSAGEFFYGFLDEIRISNSTRPADWVKTQYNNQLNPSSFHTFGSEENSLKTIIPTVPGTVPFWTNSSSNPVTEINLTPGESQIITYWVNSTGEAGTTWDFYAYAVINESAETQANTSHWNVTIVSNTPVATKFNGSSTDVLSLQSFVNVQNFTLEILNYGRILWTSDVNISGYDFDSGVDILPNYISVDADTMPGVNASANITITNLTYQKSPVVYQNGAFCQSDCPNIQYSGGILNFSVLHFTNYTSGPNSNLTVFDNLDPGTTRYNSSNSEINKPKYFYANYTNRTSGLPVNGTLEACTINISGSGFFSMAYNSTSALYEYTGSFSASGNYAYLVNCTSADYEPLNATDSISIEDLNEYLILAVGFEEGAGSIAYDLSPNRKNGTITGATWTSSAKYGRAVNFDGNDDINFGNFNITGGFTVMGWMNTRSLYPAICGSFIMKPLSYGLEVCDGTMYALIGDGAVFTAEANYTFSPDDINTWFHMAMTYDGNVLKIYVNGVGNGSQNGSFGTNSDDLRVGRWTSGEYWDGIVDSVRIYNKSLSESQVQALMDTPVHTVGLEAWDNLDSSMPYYDGSNTMAGSQKYFYANYTSNSTVFGTGSCSINFTGEGTLSVMAYNATKGLFEHNRSFPAQGTYNYAVNCTEKAVYSKSVSGSIGFGDLLDIWDSLDSGRPFYSPASQYITNITRFFANYTNASSGLEINSSLGGCSINFTHEPSSSMEMPYNATTKVYEYNRTFGSEGIYNYTVNCSADGYPGSSSSGIILIFLASFPVVDELQISPTAAFSGDVLTGYCNASSPLGSYLHFNYTWTKTNVSQGTSTEQGFSYSNTLSVSKFSTACSLNSTGQIWCWGNYEQNFDCRLGISGSSHDLEYPHTTEDLTTSFISVSVANHNQGHGCAIRKSDSRVLCWGNNEFGQLGNPTSGGCLPETINDTSAYIAVSAGTYHTCGIRYDGRVLCWGENNYGGLGTGNYTNYTIPVLINDTAKYKAIEVDEYFTCGIRLNDSRIACWGRNDAGQLGVNDTTDRPNPTYVADTAAYYAIALGVNHGCGIRMNDSKALCWGNNNNAGSLGTGDGLNYFYPVPVANLSAGAKEISANDQSSCAIRKNDSMVLCWGRNDLGQLGNGGNSTATVPTLINDTQSYAAISMGGFAACGALSNGTVYCWGNSRQLGANSSSVGNLSSPRAIDFLPGNGNPGTLRSGYLKDSYPAIAFTQAPPKYSNVTLQCCAYDAEYVGSCALSSILTVLPNSNLSVWDSLDSGQPYYDQSGGLVGSNISFFANYTNMTSGVGINSSFGGCSINFTHEPASLISMEYNSTSQLYTYNRTFAVQGLYNYTVNCTSPNYDSQALSGTVAQASCAYSGSGNWVIDASLNCHLIINTALNSNDFICSGTGSVALAANITNWTTVRSEQSCAMTILPGGGLSK